MTGLTRSAAQFVADLRYEDLPDGAADVAITGITDFAAVILLGIDERITFIVDQGAPRGAEKDTDLWVKFRTNPNNVALLNLPSEMSPVYNYQIQDRE